jgi:predicted Fe-Mo cluster-binding NifX family protein
MKIAAVTEDGVTISQLFGRASFYMVFTIENSKVASLEKRPETGLHDTNSRIIDDCQVLIAGGMGWDTFKDLWTRNIQPILTNVESVNKAVKLYIAGKLPNFIERLH